MYMKVIMKHWWGDTDNGKPKHFVKNLSQCQIAYKSHMDDVKSNPGLRDERPATNRLSHGTAPGYGTGIVCM
jgi:hypothetical protein